MKSSDSLLLAAGTLHCGMYPTGKAAISWPLVTPGSPGDIYTYFDFFVIDLYIHLGLEYSFRP